jgi:hypothetical protein
MFARSIHRLLFALVIISMTVGCGPTSTPTAEPTRTPVPTDTPIPATPTPSPLQAAMTISAGDGIEFEEPEALSVYIGQNAVSEDTQLSIKEVDGPPAPEEVQALSPAYEITLETGIVRAPVEISMPIAAPGEGQEAFIAYYDEQAGWVALPSWYSEEDQQLHASTTHFSLFRAFLSLFPIKPKIISRQVTPNPIQDVGWPPCFREPVTLRVEAEDPNGEIESVKLQLRVHNFQTSGLTNLNQFTQTMFGLGLMITAGGPTALMPAAQTALTLSQTKDPGMVASDWAEMTEDPEQPGVYVNTINLSPLSTCEGGSFEVDAAMMGVGIESIELLIQVTDDAGQSAESRISVPVISTELPYARLFSPGPSVEDAQTRLPTFSWQIENAVLLDYEQTLVYARGDTLWDRWFGKTRIELDVFDVSWSPEKELKPGDYVWGIEIKAEGQTIQSGEYHFSIPEYWVELSLDGEKVNRGEVSGKSGEVDLTWVVLHNGVTILERNANNETVLDMKEIYGEGLEDGEYTVWLKSYYANQYHKISNMVSFMIITTPLAVDTQVRPSANTWIPADVRNRSSAAETDVVFGECANVTWQITGGGATGAMLDGEAVALEGSKEYCVAKNTEYKLEIFSGQRVIDTRQGTIEIKAGRPGIVTAYAFTGDGGLYQRGGAYCDDSVFDVMEKMNTVDQYFNDHPMAFLLVGFDDGKTYYFFTEEAQISCR